jgi:DNA-binding response OmpR family regulator
MFLQGLDTMYASVETTRPVHRIIVVHDDADMRDALMAQLALHREFAAVAVNTGSKGLQAMTAGPVDLVIMNVALPDVDGREAVRIMRKSGFTAPIMLTGDDTDSDTVLGLESGANDYVGEPYRFPVLLARIRAQLRQHEASEDAVFSIGPYTFRPSLKLLVHPDGNKTRLTEKESAILKYLYRAAPRPVSREVLLEKVWRYNSRVRSHTLETHIYRLRQKIETIAADPTILVTVDCGYLLVPAQSRRPSRGVDDAHPDHAQGCHAGYEEIFAAAGLHELGNSLDDERRVT